MMELLVRKSRVRFMDIVKVDMTMVGVTRENKGTE